MNNSLTEQLLSKEEKTDSKKNVNNLDINIKHWDDDIEDLLKSWGEKSASLSVLHNKDRQYWRNKSNNLSIACIIITTISSSLSLSSLFFLTSTIVVISNKW